jgi:hypothetical protein
LFDETEMPLGRPGTQGEFELADLTRGAPAAELRRELTRYGFAFGRGGHGSMNV